MNNFRKLIATFFAVSFIITAVIAILLFNFDRRAFTAETYQRAFAREDFYNKIPSMMAQAIFSSDADKGQLPLMMQSMSVEAWESFLRTLLPPETLKPMGDDVLNSTFAYLNQQTDSVQVNLTPLKSALVSETGTQAVISLIATLPACTFEQVTQITFNIFSGGQIELCNPPAEVLPLLTPVIQGQLQFAASIIPDSLTLVTAPLENDPRERLQTARLYMRLSLILPILSLLTLTILTVRSLHDWLNWWGVPFAITGFSAFVMGLFGAPVLGIVIENLLASRMPDYLPSFLLDFTGEFAAAMVRALLSPIMWQGLILIIVGGTMIIAGRFIKK